MYEHQHYEHQQEPARIERNTILKTPPHTHDGEQALLATIMAHPEALYTVDVAPEHFYRKEHRLLWQTILQLQADQKPITFLTVADALGTKGNLKEAGGIEYFEELLQMHGSAANAKYYGELIRGKALERYMISMAHAIADIGYNFKGDTAAKLQEAYKVINRFMLDGKPARSEARQVKHALEESIRRVEKRAESPGEVHGLMTGFADLDARTGGLMAGDLIIIAARPSMGKTQLALNIAENVAIRGELVIVFSLEMQEWKLADRILCSLARVDATSYRKGTLTNQDWDNLSMALAKMREAPLYIDEDSSLTSDQLLPRCRRIMHQAGKSPALIVVDYLGLLNDDGENESRVIATMTRALKRMAKELNCPVVTLAQLNRGLEARAEKRPSMADLRGSGAIEQDADVIAFVYRDEVYNKINPRKGVAEIILAKLRDGPIGTVELATYLHRNKFENMAKQHSAPVQPAPAASDWWASDATEYGI